MITIFAFITVPKFDVSDRFAFLFLFQRRVNAAAYFWELKLSEET